MFGLQLRNGWASDGSVMAIVDHAVSNTRTAAVLVRAVVVHYIPCVWTVQLLDCNGLRPTFLHILMGLSILLQTRVHLKTKVQ